MKMSLKLWSNECWKCKDCGIQVEAKQEHGQEDCIRNLNSQLAISNLFVKSFEERMLDAEKRILDLESELILAKAQKAEEMGLMHA